MTKAGTLRDRVANALFVMRTAGDAADAVIDLCREEFARVAEKDRATMSTGTIDGYFAIGWTCASDAIADAIRQHELAP